MRMVLTALFKIVQTRKQSKCLPTVGWIHEFWHIHVMEYYRVGVNKFFLQRARQ